MRHLCYLLVLSLLALQGAAVEPNPKRDAIYYPLSARMDAARSNANPVVEIAQIARQAEQDYAREVPEAMALVFNSAAHLISFSLQTNNAPRPTFYEMLHRQRRYLGFVPLTERFRMLYWRLPLNSQLEQLVAPSSTTSRRMTELELVLETWRDLNSEIERVKDWPFEVIYASTQRDFFPRDPTGEVAFQKERARNEAAAKRSNFVADLRNKGGSFTNQLMGQIAREYGSTPQLVAQLQEVMDGYLPPEASTNVMNKVFEAMKPGVAAKTPRPVPGAKGERWLRPEMPGRRSESGLPAIARPSRIREGISNRASQPAASAPSGPTAAITESVSSKVGHPEGQSVWPWAMLGLATVVGGWIWLRHRG